MRTKADCLPIQLVNVTITREAEAAIVAAGQTVDHFLGLHSRGDWGNFCEEDSAFYDRALVAGSTVTSEFITDNFDRIHIYTAIGRYTSIYLPGER